MDQTKFKSIEKASERWISEGKKYKNAINDWLDIIYIDKQNPTEECPEETRKDMADYVLDTIVEFNKNKQYDELRLLFPPDNDPINWEGITGCVSQVNILPDNRLIVTINEWHQKRYMYSISGNDIQLIEGDLFMFGKSHDKKYFAKAYPDRIDVCEGWDGKIVSTFTPPKDYGNKLLTKNSKLKDGLSELDFSDMFIHNITVFPKGNKIGIASKVGIFVLEKELSHFVKTEDIDKENEEEGFILSLDYPHIDVSPDEKYIAVGSYSSPHLVLENSDKGWVVIATVEPRSSYPNLAKFNYLIPKDDYENGGTQLLLCSCHFRQSASISLPIKRITKGFSASGYDADDTLNYIDDKKWIFAAGNYSWGWALGANDGYIWFKHIGGFQYGYLHVGGTVMDIDFSEDRKTMVVASYSGQVIVYDISEFFSNNTTLFRNSKNKQEKRRDIYAITNTAYKDVKRYLFLKDYEPMIW